MAPYDTGIDLKSLFGLNRSAPPSPIYSEYWFSAAFLGRSFAGATVLGDGILRTEHMESTTQRSLDATIG